MADLIDELPQFLEDEVASTRFKFIHGLLCYMGYDLDDLDSPQSLAAFLDDHEIFLLDCGGGLYQLKTAVGTVPFQETWVNGVLKTFAPSQSIEAIKHRKLN